MPDQRVVEVHPLHPVALGEEPLLRVVRVVAVVAGPHRGHRDGVSGALHQQRGDLAHQVEVIVGSAGGRARGDGLRAVGPHVVLVVALGRRKLQRGHPAHRLPREVDVVLVPATIGTERIPAGDIVQHTPDVVPVVGTARARAVGVGDLAELRTLARLHVPASGGVPVEVGPEALVGIPGVEGWGDAAGVGLRAAAAAGRLETLLPGDLRGCLLAEARTVGLLVAVVGKARRVSAAGRRVRKVPLCVWWLHWLRTRLQHRSGRAPAQDVPRGAIQDPGGIHDRVWGALHGHQDIRRCRLVLVAVPLAPSPVGHNRFAAARKVKQDGAARGRALLHRLRARHVHAEAPPVGPGVVEAEREVVDIEEPSARLVVPRVLNRAGDHLVAGAPLRGAVRQMPLQRGPALQLQQGVGIAIAWSTRCRRCTQGDDP
mmetsp:Transcript_87177/g.231628  ORF Transcript_87177/g.231628 Transcript_87177/m.231628 type:complete len:429 (+) Transcript_87177:168-1454(+)